MAYSIEARELVEVSILAQGEEAQSRKFLPSKHEGILGRDFLFALRCIGDQIPIRPKILMRCLERVVDELVYHCGPARFEHYREALNMRLLHLAESESAIHI